MSDVLPLSYCLPPNRGFLALTGEDRVKFLQGLVSNDVRAAAPDRAIYAWFMTPQGKYLHDFFIYDVGDALLLEVEADRRDDLLRRLKMYKLRSKIALEDVGDRYAAVLLFGGGAAAAAGFAGDAERGAARGFCGGWAAVDPRSDELGVRLILPRESAADAIDLFGAAETGFAAYDRLRLSLGAPDGARDLIPEKSIAMENGMDGFGALSWDKGCYMGQELTARTKYRGLVKKRLTPMTVEGPLPAAGTIIRRGDREAGELRSGGDGLALALLRIEEIDGVHADDPAPFVAEQAALRPRRRS